MKTDALPIRSVRRMRMAGASVVREAPNPPGYSPHCIDVAEVPFPPLEEKREA
jgi:hypothetical protein